MTGAGKKVAGQTSRIISVTSEYASQFLLFTELTNRYFLPLSVTTNASEMVEKSVLEFLSVCAQF